MALLIILHRQLQHVPHVLDVAAGGVTSISSAIVLQLGYFPSCINSSVRLIRTSGDRLLRPR
jgi:hypothetical protein